jgi:Zn-dependent peptidase ImmA (M78 family)
MLPELTPDEFAAALDACAVEVLWEAAVEGPPVDAELVAQRLGLVVAQDESMPCRGRFVRLTGRAFAAPGQGTILVGPAERPERRQWAVAHEIGESVAHRVSATLGIRSEAVPPDARELVANHLASCLLLPRNWFAADGVAFDWDLFALKERYATASHELIARRMLEMNPPVVITLCDLGRVQWRRGNLPGRVPRMLPEEQAAWQRSHAGGAIASETLDPAATGLERVRAWPVHEPDWKREIVRSDVAEW